MTTINREKLKKVQEREAKRFVAEHPRSAELYKRAQHSLLGGVPMNWMKKWAGEFPVFVTKAKGAHFTCADAKEYVDLCLGDTGAMTGHSPEVVAEAVAKRVKHGITLMLPTEDAIFVGEDLKSDLASLIGNSRLLLRMPIAFRFALRAKSRSGRKFSFSTTAITARWMKLSPRWKTAWWGRGAGTSGRRSIPRRRRASSNSTI